MASNSNQVEEEVSFQELLMGIRNEERRRLVSSFLQKLVQRMSKNREKVEELVVTAQGGITDENVLELMSDIFGVNGDSDERWGSQEQPAIGSSSDPAPGSSHVKKLRRSVPISVQGQEMEGSKENIEDESHPLLQPPILEVLFKKVPLEDLKKCRLVCKTWRAESQSSWWTNATLEFEKEGIVRELQYSTNTTTLEQYLDFCESGCSQTPFKKLHISEWNFKVGDKNQTRFFELLRKHITSLTFSFCSFDGRDTVRAIIYQKFPKLQFLKMEGCDFPTSSEYKKHRFYEGPAGEVVAYQEPALGVHGGLKSLHLDGCLPDSMSELLSHFHMLDDVRWIDSIYHDDLLKILAAVKIIRKHNPDKLPLGKFRADLIFLADKEPVNELAVLNLLQELNLPLDTLYISTRYRDSVWNLEQFGEIISDILRKHSSTLRQIDTSRARGGFQGILREFPFGHQLNNLKRVKVSANFFSNLNWLMNTQNLEDLEVYHWGDFDPSNNVISNSSQLQLRNWSLPSFKRLRIDSPISAVNLRKLIGWLPNMESLSMKLGDENFAIICAYWKQLKELTIYGDQLTDKGVTGIWMDSALPDEETRIAANILQLKSLKTFEARCSPLTQKSVYEGLLRLPSLVTLHLNWRLRSEIGAEAIAALNGKGITVHF